MIDIQNFIGVFLKALGCVLLVTAVKQQQKLEAFASNHSTNKLYDSVTSLAEIELKASSFVVNFISEEIKYNTVCCFMSLVVIHM